MKRDNSLVFIWLTALGFMMFVGVVVASSQRNTIQDDYDELFHDYDKLLAVYSRCCEDGICQQPGWGNEPRRTGILVEEMHGNILRVWCDDCAWVETVDCVYQVNEYRNSPYVDAWIDKRCDIRAVAAALGVTVEIPETRRLIP